MTNTSDKMNLVYSHTDNGFCRVYYHRRDERKRHARLYCMQSEHMPHIAEKYGYEAFTLYRCSKDGEPSYPIGMEYVETIERPKAALTTCIELNDYLDKKGL